MYKRIDTVLDGMKLRERGTTSVYWTVTQIKDDICILTRDDRPTISRAHTIEEVASGDIYTADPIPG